MLELLRFFKSISVNKEFLEKVDASFIKELIHICELFKRCDIIHFEVFAILQNIMLFILANQESFVAVCDFILKSVQSFELPGYKCKKLNAMSLNFMALLA